MIYSLREQAAAVRDSPVVSLRRHTVWERTNIARTSGMLGSLMMCEGRSVQAFSLLRLLRFLAGPC